jgi:hypothetical protein
MPKNMKYDKASAMAGSSKKKGAAESKEQEKKDLLNDMPVDEVAGASKGKDHKKPVARKKGGAKHHGNMDSKKGATDHKEGHKGGAQYKEGGADHKEGHKGSGKKKGAAGFNSHTSDTHKHPHPEGPSRMGFTQNFGPARQNSYARGAAKVAKIMGYGAADAGHGEPTGHDHPTKTIKSRQVSGGGSDSSSSSVSNSNIPEASGGEQTKNISGYMTALNKRFPSTSGADLASKNYISSDMIGNYDSNFSSNSSSSSNPRGVSESSTTTVSPMSMSETLKKGQLVDFNRAQNNQFNKDITNITAANDSIAASNKYIDNRPPHAQNDPRVLETAKKFGGRAAFITRKDSGDFSTREAGNILNKFTFNR